MVTVFDPSSFSPSLIALSIPFNKLTHVKPQSVESG